MLHRKTLLIPLLLMIGMLVWGCASPPKKIHLEESDFDNKPMAMINPVPFVEQTSQLCGPTSLYMVAKKQLPSLKLDEVTRITLTPAAAGSYKQDMLAAARRLGLAPYRVESLSQLFEFLAHGTPVVIFHETSFFTKHFWHYSVLTGYNRLHETFYLHIGPYAYHEMDISEVVQSWEVGGHWAFVVETPGLIPDGAPLAEARDNAITFLRMGDVPSAEKLGLAMRERWPNRYEADVILADAFGKKNENKKALKHLQFASRKQPENAALRRLVQDLLHTGYENQQANSSRSR